MFAPTPEEAANLALSSQMLCRDLIRKYAVSLGITNIRILRKIVNLTELIHKEVSTLHSGVTEQAVMTLVLLVWCLYDSDEKKPTLEFILEWNRLMWGFDEIKEEDPTRAGWVKVLQSYGLTGLDEFDQTIIKVIQRGYLEETGFLEEANKLDAQIRANELEQSFTKAWGLFHDTFTNNEAELVNALAESFRKSVLHISPLNLNGTTRLLRQLGHGDIADELIDFYIEHRTQEVDLFNLADNPFSSDITDPAILERFNAKHSSFKPTLTIADAISYIATNSGFSNIHTEPLMKATEEDYYALFKIDHGEALSRIVKSCLQFDNWNDDKKSIGIKARSALVRIGKESPLNAIRVRRYGITNEDLTDAAKPAAN
jgi:hypothetical protein